MREAFQRLRDWFRRDQLTSELDEELAFHRRLLERDATAEGADSTTARRRASQRLGNVTLAREDARQRWSIPWMEQIWRDTRYAARGLRRSPGFTFTVVITLGLGLGANSAMFSVVDRLMFRPLAYLRDPGTVHRLYWQWTDRERNITSQSGPYTRFLDVQRGSSSFSQMAAFSERPIAVGEGESMREMRVGVVSASYFAFFDAKPVLGRFFAAEEDETPRGADVAVLSYTLWQSQYGGRNVLGERLQIGNVRATIVGVAPRNFHGVNDADPPMVWIPITTYAGSGGTSDSKTYFSNYSWGWTQIIARRKPGVSIERAEADASAAYQRSWTLAAQTEPGTLPIAAARPHVAVSAVRPGAGPEPGLEARTALWLTLVAIIVLLIATANVANLFVARALRRQRETAVRLALGASRRRLLAQAIIESLVISTLSAASALLVAQWATAAIRRLFEVSAVSVDTPTFEWRTVGVTIGLALIVGVVIGALTAVLTRHDQLSGALRSGTRGGAMHGARLRAILLMIQGTLSTSLLIGAVLFVRSLNAVKSMPMGYDAEQVLLVERVLIGTRPADSVVRVMNAQLLAHAQSLPDVESAAWVATVPFWSNSMTDIFVAGIDSVGRLGTFTYQVMTPEYFRTMKTRVLRGRELSVDDRLGAPDVAVVSEGMAKLLWPGQDAIGRCFRMRADTNPCLNVVGVAQDIVQRDIIGTQRLHYYIPLAQSRRTSGNYMLMRVRGDPAVVGETLRRTLQAGLAGGGFLTMRPMRDLVAREQRSWRLGATMFALFSSLALVVAAVGLYGVIGYNVTQRIHELGVRVALGAQRTDIVQLVVGQSVRYVLYGVVAGVVVAIFVGRWLEPLLFRQTAIDPTVYGAVAAVMLSVAVGASALPARRAARVDPATALRAD